MLAHRLFDAIVSVAFYLIDLIIHYDDFEGQVGVHINQGIQEYLAEFTSEQAWGENGYLGEKGMIPMPDEEKAKFRSDIMNFQILMSLK